MNELERRLFRAYFRRFGKDAMQPSLSVEHHQIGDREYAKLWNVHGTLAVYRIHEDGKIRFLKIYPKAMK
jgi:hypothetical protein